MPIDAQRIDAALSMAAVFRVATVANEQSVLAEVCSLLEGLDDLVKTLVSRATTCRSAGRDDRNSAPISSAIPGIFG